MPPVVARAKSLRVESGQAEDAQKVVGVRGLRSWIDPSWVNSGILSLNSGGSGCLAYGSSV